MLTVIALYSNTIPLYVTSICESGVLLPQPPLDNYSSRPFLVEDLKYRISSPSHVLNSSFFHASTKMASSSRNSAATGQSFAANHNFQPGMRTQLEQAEDDLRRLKGVYAALKDGAPPGKDKATMAGYDPQRRNRAITILKEIDITEKEANGLDGDIGLVKRAVIANQSTSLIGIDAQDKEARKRASARVVDFISGSAENTETFFSGFGIKVRPEVSDAARSALKELSVSNANPIHQESTLAKDLVSAKKALADNQSILGKTKKACDEYKDAWRRAKDENDRLVKKFDQQSRDLFQANQDLAKSRKEPSAVDRDKANRDSALLKTQFYKADRRATEAEERAKKFQDENLELEQRIGEANDTVNSLRSSYFAYKRQVSDLKEVCSDQKETLQASKESCDAANAEVQRLQSELDSSGYDHLNETQRLRTEKEDADRRIEQVIRDLEGAKGRLEDTRQELRDIQIAHSSNSASLNSANEEVIRVKGECQSLQRTVEEQRRDLEDKDRKIRELEKASEEKDASITQRDETINSQIQKASTFLRHLSLNVESDTWKSVAENVLADSTSTSITSNEWLPWVIFPSWSEDASLATREDTRGPEAVALNVLVILKDKSTDAKDLLALLHNLQQAMEEFKSMVSTIAQLLLEAFDKAVGDHRLHLMHRFAMCQIANLMGSTAEVQQFMQALEAVDPRIQRLVHALREYRLNNSVLPMEEAISYPSVALAGFDRDPRGVIAVSLTDNGVCWVDSTHIKTEFTLLKVVSEKGDSIELPLDTPERLSWAMTYL
ncbi:hypothetical protein FGADI_12499 [Fusarium gaditjirri]|uniref:Uncharacterized protein n=1 Tax=Fusarium gaditjirri TaxID=282569 RepID=A0A8H4SS08_9HYPO|nr:hypothetical protein FGADI_12499 [Fusarium gaditjirri]